MFKWLVCLPVLFPVAAFASDTCMLADEMDATLVDWYGERVVSQTDEGDAALWHNEVTGTWTIVEYQESGLACVLLFGDPASESDRSPELMVRLSL